MDKFFKTYLSGVLSVVGSVCSIAGLVMCFSNNKTVQFDKDHKLYYHTKINPEPGYIYRLRWEK